MSAPADRGTDRLVAYKLWLENGKPSIRTLAKLLVQNGIKVHHATLQKWTKTIPEWSRQILDKEPARPARIIAALKDAQDDATALVPEVFLGVKAQLVARLYDSVKELPLGSVDDWIRALDCCERLEGLIHAERGKVILEKGSSIVSTGLMDRLNPSISIPTFKKPNGGAA